MATGAGGLRRFARLWEQPASARRLRTERVRASSAAWRDLSRRRRAAARLVPGHAAADRRFSQAHRGPAATGPAHRRVRKMARPRGGAAALCAIGLGVGFWPREACSLQSLGFLFAWQPVLNGGASRQTSRASCSSPIRFCATRPCRYRSTGSLAAISPSRRSWSAGLRSGPTTPIRAGCARLPSVTTLPRQDALHRPPNGARTRKPRPLRHTRRAAPGSAASEEGWSPWRDLNSRPPAPHGRYATRLRYAPRMTGFYP